ncbi:MAG: hypothetical protein KJ561_02460, partial [Nanoarchaeota archaeon]|nr:hypothetical protein [Nanoarchaeota archaeon]
TVNAYEGEDNIIFRKHNQRTAKNFDVWEHSGDSKYLCRENCDDVEFLFPPVYSEAVTGGA